MKLYKYKDYVSESKQSKEDIIDKICRKYRIRNYTINHDGTVDVDDNFSFFNRGMTKLPLKFGKVTGNFNCSFNELTSLEGCPYEVGGDFWCSSNKLTSLEGCPREVGGDFNCSRNQLTSLEGAPTEFSGDFWCNDNKLSSLEGCPESVGYFYCSNNYLASLDGGPEIVGANFWCSHNKLKDVKGFPKIVKGGVDISYNPVHEIFKLFSQDRWVEVPEFLNEYDVIRDGNKVVLQALELVYDELGIEAPENIEIKGYEII